MILLIFTGIIAVYGEEVLMLKFKFDYLDNTLAYQTEKDLWNQIAEERQFADDYGGLGFRLSPGWISFRVYENKIRAFYKHIESPNWFTYYRKDLPQECPVIFEFTEQDQVEKVGNRWVKKGGQHA